MKNAFASKMSYFILTFIFLIITASFLFSGFDNFSLGGGKNVATVDGTHVTIKEYQIALNRQVEFFNQMMGGKGMTQKQLEEMGIKQSVMNGLIQQKLIANTADSMGLIVSLDEIKNEIKNLPYFKRGEQFDVGAYRNVLQSNGYSPTQFEELIGNDLKQKKVDELFNTTVVSENFVKDVLNFKNNTVNVHAIKISRQSLAPLVSVSEQEIKDYLAKPENQKSLEAAYTENYAKYNQSEEVKARHILIKAEDPKALDKVKAIRAKVTNKNFGDIAGKESEDSTGKTNGGDLGWFSRGRMVPEFEDVAFKMTPGTISEPIKTQFGYHIIYVEDKKAAQTKPLEVVKAELAQIALQKTKAQDLDKLLESEREKTSALLNANKLAELDALQKKLDAQLFKNTDVNQYDQTVGQMNLSPKEAEELFKAKAGDILNFGNAGTIYLVKVNSKAQGQDKKVEDQLAAEMTAQGQAFSRKAREELIKTLNNKAKIVTNPALM
ncbi:MAG: SurA N-terminal domain-containing protein [Bdellovibrionales bacterium]|nr:SurA N-terminal domain-containing protein [Bdellovibrionales bacterium]